MVYSHILIFLSRHPHIWLLFSCTVKTLKCAILLRPCNCRLDLDLVMFLNFALEEPLSWSWSKVLILARNERCLALAPTGNALNTKVNDSAAYLNGFIVAWDQRSALSDENKCAKLREVVLQVKTSMRVAGIWILLKLNDSMAT